MHPAGYFDKYWTLHDVELVIPHKDMAGYYIEEATDGAKCTSGVLDKSGAAPFGKWAWPAEDFDWGIYKGTQSFFYNHGGGGGEDQVYGTKTLGMAPTYDWEDDVGGSGTMHCGGYQMQLWWDFPTGISQNGPTKYITHEDQGGALFHACVVERPPTSEYRGMATDFAILKVVDDIQPMSAGTTYEMFDWLRHTMVETKIFGIYGQLDYDQGAGESDVPEYDMGITGTAKPYTGMHQAELGQGDDHKPHLYYSWKKGIIHKYVPPPWWSCFTGNTKITMADGKKKDIELIREGEKVLSYNHKTKKIIESTVMKAFEHKNTPWYLVINDSLRVTPMHEIYNGLQWKKAKDFQIGDHIQTFDGTLRKIETMERIDLSTRTYNIHVDDENHNYFAEDYLVHNKSVHFPPGWPPAKPPPRRPPPGGGGGRPGYPPCFAGDTMISMSDGTEKPIKDIKVGDKVLGWDVKGNTSIETEVKETSVHPNTNGYFIINDRLQVTAEHPLHTSIGWKKAGDIKVNDSIQSINGLILVESVGTCDDSVTTYNFEVDSKHHNYFANSYLAHNKTIIAPPPGTTTKPPKPPFSPPPQTSCFTGDVEITLTDGMRKPIKDIEVGDKILGWDVKNNTSIETEISNKFIHENTQGYFIINDHLRVTAEHPMYTGSQWKKAGDIKVNDSIQSANGLLLVESVDTCDDSVTTYNVEVESEHHNYFANGYLAHNKTPVMPPPPPWPPGGGGTTGTSTPSGGSSVFPPWPVRYGPPKSGTHIWDCSGCGTGLSNIPTYVGVANDMGTCKSNIEQCTDGRWTAYKTLTPHLTGSCALSAISTGQWSPMRRYCYPFDNKFYIVNLGFIQAYIDIAWWIDDPSTTRFGQEYLKNPGAYMSNYAKFTCPIHLFVDKDGILTCIEEFRAVYRSLSGNYPAAGINGHASMTGLITPAEWLSTFSSSSGQGAFTTKIKPWRAVEIPQPQSQMTGCRGSGTSYTVAHHNPQAILTPGNLLQSHSNTQENHTYFFDNLGEIDLDILRGRVTSYRLATTATNLTRMLTATNLDGAVQSSIYVPANEYGFVQPMKVDTTWPPSISGQTGATSFVVQGSGHNAWETGLCYTVIDDITATWDTLNEPASSDVPTLSGDIRNWPVYAGLNPPPVYYSTSRSPHASAGGNPNFNIGAIAMHQIMGRPRKRLPVACGSAIIQHHDHQPRKYDLFNMKFSDRLYRDTGVLFHSGPENRLFSLTELYFSTTTDLTVISNRLKVDHNGSTAWSVTDFTSLTALSAYEFAVYLDEYGQTTLIEPVTSAVSSFAAIGMCTLHGKLTAANGAFYFAGLAKCNKPSWISTQAEIGGVHPSQENYVVCTTGTNISLPYMTTRPASGY
ncbi:hypothetical protein CL634_08595 [bacterium]|nr:hypothetical protein [bacterium]